MIDPERALTGRDSTMPVAAKHTVLGNPLTPPFPRPMSRSTEAVLTRALPIKATPSGQQARGARRRATGRRGAGRSLGFSRRPPLAGW
jgi:hypothetical protein